MILRQPEQSDGRPIEVIRKRRDFLAANRGQRHVTPGFILLVFRRSDDDRIRYGTTVTKKIGNAVIRNRMKRRFRALIADCLPRLGISGADHILIGRKDGIERDFAQMQGELEKGLRRLARKMEKAD